VSTRQFGSTAVSCYLAEHALAPLILACPKHSCFREGMETSGQGACTEHTFLPRLRLANTPLPWKYTSHTADRVVKYHSVLCIAYTLDMRLACAFPLASEVSSLSSAYSRRWYCFCEPPYFIHKLQCRLCLTWTDCRRKVLCYLFPKAHWATKKRTCKSSKRRHAGDQAPRLSRDLPPWSLRANKQLGI
jgi:hypothetical protein